MEKKSYPSGLGNCGIVSLVYLCDVTYEEALRAILGVKVEKRGNWKGSTTLRDRQEAISLLGFTQKTYRTKNLFGREVTLSLLEKEAGPLLKGRKVMLKVRGHAFVYLDGRVWDQCNVGKPANEVGFKDCRVTHITEIISG